MCAAVVVFGQENHHKLSLACRQECGTVVGSSEPFVDVQDTATKATSLPVQTLQRDVRVRAAASIQDGCYELQSTVPCRYNLSKFHAW